MKGNKKDGFAGWTMEDMVVVFVEALASCAAVVYSNSFALSPFVHDFIGRPEFEGEFCGGAAAAGSLSVTGKFDSVPVY